MATGQRPAVSVWTAYGRVLREAKDEIREFRSGAVSYALLGFFAFMLLSRYCVTVPVVLQMMAYTIPIIAAGSFMSLKDAQAAADGAAAERDVISQKDAVLFPLIASAALFLIYLAFKYLPAYWVNVVFSLHIALTGIYATGVTVTALWAVLHPETAAPRDRRVYPVTRAWLRWVLGRENVVLELSVAKIIGFGVGTACSLGWLLTKAWITHNLFAMGFCVHAIRIISVGTFRTATILLCGLFFYDVFWVFKTDVMVTVAKSFDAPAKLLFPTSSNTMSLLGLGDIVIPGIFIAMTLRYDYYRSGEKQQFSKFYFKSSMIAYACSLTLTGLVMLFWNRAQPALLYLVPSLLVSVYTPALIRGELSTLLNYSEEDVENDEDDDEDEEEEDAQPPENAQDPDEVDETGIRQRN